MKTFTKWFLFNAIALTAFFLAEQRGAISLIVENDLSHISIVIILLYLFFSAFAGRLCYLSDRVKTGREREELLKRADIGWFAAEHFFSLGLLGTIIGLTIATQTSLKDTGTISEVVAGLKVGLNTAFYTTICGIIFSIPLQIQLMILKDELDQ
ncbi:hypothetical protein CMI37_22085 [Candidatus Pacearchaeota archaeon]|nr:hypothetical protein [Candidatus Pacearchaeota archaeon]|tara:strand:- start:1342 stop:1803 length:462 start_codon:yes stop_codon:yes gene_type:complete